MAKSASIPSRSSRWKKWALVVAASSVFFLSVLELAYRFQWVDTYAGALHGLNTPSELSAPGRTILVMGDSFSAFRDSWVKDLRVRFPNYRVVNSSVSGTGIVQADFMARRRFREFKPDLMVYQIYVGNDLADYRYPSSWTRMNPVRNVYGWASGWLRSLSFLNQALGGFSSDLSAKELQQRYEKPFSVDDYNEREKIMLSAEPGLIENQVALAGGREADMPAYLERLDDLLQVCEAQGTQAILMVLPHAAQVEPSQLEHMKLLGATFGSQWPKGDDYPFLNRLAAHVQGRALVLSPLGDMRTAENSGLILFYPNDPHLTEAGQRWLGSWLCAAMRELDFTTP